MKINTNPTESPNFDPEKCNDVYERLIQAYQEADLTVPEIIVSLSNLTYSLGASIGGYTDKGPSAEELEKLYYASPSVDTALMLQALTMVTWSSQYTKLVDIPD